MKLKNRVTLNLLVYSCLLLPVVARIQYTDLYNNNCEVSEKQSCNAEIRKQLRTKAFIQKLIKEHMSKCFIIQLRNNNNFGFNLHFSNIPTIDVNLHNSSASTSFQHFNTNSRRTLIRFQEQCIIFYVTFLKDELQSVKHFKFLTKVFLHPRLHGQAHQSYVFINDFENEDANHGTAKKVLLHPALRDYEHKTWIEAMDQHQGNNNEGAGSYELSQNRKTVFQINNFCYFCKDGEAGIETNPKLFTDGRQLKDLQSIFPDVTSNLYGKKMKVTAAMALPFAGILSSPLNPNDLRIEGMQGTILKAFAKTLNFTIVLENTSKGLTGSQLPNGTWTGTIGEVYYGRADIGLNAATSSDRHEIVDFTVSAYYGFLVLISTKPSPFFEWQAIVYPFEITVWLAICASTCITVAAYRFFLNNAIIIDEKKESKRPRNRNVSYIKVCYITIGTLLEQGMTFNYRTTPSRIYTMFWWMFIIVSTCAYKSKLFSYLTFPIIKTPPSTFYELSISDYSWGLKSLGGVALLFITKSPVSYIRQVGENMEISMDKYSCLDKTFTPKFTCIIYKAYYDYMSAVRYWKLAHKFYVSDYVTPPVGSSWVLPKYSPLLPPLDRLTFTQFEMGLAGIYLEHYIKTMALRSRALAQASMDANDLFETNTKFKRETVLEKPLQFDNVYASFLILSFGGGISAAILTAEIIRSRHLKFFRKKPQMKQARRLRLHGLHLLRGNRKRKQVRIVSTMILYPQIQVEEYSDGF